MKSLKIMFLLLCTASIAAAQSQQLSLKQAIDFALANQTNVKNALIEEDISKQKVNELTGLGTPQISGEASLNKYIEIPVAFFPDFISKSTYGVLYNENLVSETRFNEVNNAPLQFFSVPFGQEFTASAGLTVSQLIFDGSYLVGLQASKTYRELSRKQTQQTKIETAVAVSKAYYNVLVSTERLALVEKNVERLKKLHDDTKATYDAGFIEKLDNDRVELTYNNILVQEKNVKRLVELSYILLKFQMGMDQKTQITLTDKLDEGLWNGMNIPESADPSKRIEYSVLKTSERLQELDLKRYKATYLPSLAGFGSLSTNASRDEFTIFNSGYRWYPTALIGLKLTVPIWDGMQKNSRVQQSKLSVQRAENTLANFEQAATLEYASSKTALENNLATLEMSKRNRDIAADIVKASRLKFDNGVGSSLEVVDAESSLKEAETNYFSSLYETIVSKIDVDKALGNITY
jgi:outer membrane protein